MNKYIISIRSKKNPDDITQGGAATKAPKDILYLAIQQGYIEIPIYTYTSYNNLHRTFVLILQLLKAAFRIEKNSIVLFQYPEIHPFIYPIILPFFKKFKTIAIIHDINSLREKGYLNKLENYNFSSFNEIIVHSTQMKHILEERNNYSNFHILNYFPYLAKEETNHRTLGHEICFAGNIYKSPSIIQYFNKIKECKLLLYIKLRPNLILNERTIYKGLFDPDHIENIEGNWGLIWDSNDLNDCTGNLGEYTKFNAPHKLSLYSVAHLPIIAWDKSAIAHIIKEKNIGFTISSLLEIEDKINSITPSQYNTFMQNICKLYNEVTSGNNFISILKSIESKS